MAITLPNPPRLRFAKCCTSPATSFALSLITPEASLPNFSAFFPTPFISSITEFLIEFISTFSPFISNFSEVVNASGITIHRIIYTIKDVGLKVKRITSPKSQKPPQWPQRERKERNGSRNKTLGIHGLTPK